MDYQIKTTRVWPYRDPKRGRQNLDPGTYDVPEQISDALARLAIEQGVAMRIAAPKPQGPALAPQNRRKGPAPKNKSRGPAPENKATLV